MKIKVKYQINKKHILKKNGEKFLLQKQKNRYIQIRDLVILYVELENRLRAMEENKKNISINDSEKQQKL